MPPVRPRDRLRVVAVLAGAAVAVVLADWWAAPVGAGAAYVLVGLLRRIEPAAVRAERRAAAADLPLAADLLAAALHSGAPVDAATAEVASALGGALGERLARVARATRLGAAPAEAWDHLRDVPGAGRFAAGAVRSAASGAAMASALTRLADDLRADRGVAAEGAARRAAVLIVLPLGLCFLPAFILAGLVPVLVAVLGDVM
jgi:pilus assembly protein TadC